MKNFRYAVTAAIMALLALAPAAKAADEKARRDVNYVPSTLAVTSGTPTELRNLKATNEGYLLTVSTGSGAPISGTVTANQGTAAATSGAWPTKVTDGTDVAEVTASNALRVSLQDTNNTWATPAVSTGACGSSATLALPANISAKTSLFCNDGTDAVRVGPAGVTATVGLKVLGSSCVTLDGPLSAFVGAFYCIRTTGSDQAFSTMQGQ